MRTNPTKLIPCRYFLQNLCKLGKNCPYSHDFDKKVAILPDAPPVCAFFMQGYCMYGESCKFRHLTKKEFQEEERRKNEQPEQSSSKPRLKPLGSPEKPPEEVLDINKISFKPKPVNFARAVDSSEPSSSSTNSSTLKKSSSTKLKASAKAFVPMFSSTSKVPTSNSFSSNPPVQKIKDFCPEHSETGFCSYQNYEGYECPYETHGSQCPICTLYLINEEDPKDQHLINCNRQNEAEILENIKIQKSETQTCTICLEVVWEKSNSSLRRFGILENCNHVFCLSCIREWRSSKSADKSAIRGCPTCRKDSHFVIPSNYFLEDGEEKTKLIEDYWVGGLRKSNLALWIQRDPGLKTLLFPNPVFP